MSHGADAVVTGFGCESPFGSGIEALWSGLFTGHRPEPPTTFDGSGYRASGVHCIPRDDHDHPDYPLRIARHAMRQSLAVAGLTGEVLRTAGLVLASTSAGWHRPDEAFGRRPIEDVEPLFKETPAAALAGECGLAGPGAVISTACASSTDAIAWAVERLRSGDTGVMVAGAVDVVTEVVFAGFHAMRLLSTGVTRPFAADRDGFVLAEGAAFVVLERRDHAQRRGCVPLALVSGWGASTDASHVTTPDPAGIARSWAAALSDAQLRERDIAVLHAHGTASTASDRAELAAAAKVFGDRLSEMPITALKGPIGHTEGAAGMFSTIVAVEAIRRRQLPPARTTGPVPPADLPHTAVLRELPAMPGRPVAPALVHASGFGGANSTLVIDRADAPAPRRAPRHRSSGPRARVLAAVLSDPMGTRFVGARGSGLPPVDPAWPRNPQPDAACRQLGDAIGALLSNAGPGTTDRLRAGGLCFGTAYGSQQHHVRMDAGIRRRGSRGVNPLDFALSTFNTPAAMAAVAFGITGMGITFLGGTGGAEALATAVDLVTAGRVDAMIAAAHDASENRLPGLPEEPDVVGAIAISVGHACDGPGADVIGARRLPALRSGLHAAMVSRAVTGLLGADGGEVWVHGTAPGDVPGSWNRCEPPGDAVRPLRMHLDALSALAVSGGRAVVVTIGVRTPTVLIGYRWAAH